MTDLEQQRNQPSNEGQGDREITKQVLIRSSDMTPEQECLVVGISNSSIEQNADLPGIFETQKFSKIAGSIKKELDEKFGGGWYVLVGKNYGTYVTHEYGTFMHFSYDDLHICIFRAK